MSNLLKQLFIIWISCFSVVSFCQDEEVINNTFFYPQVNGDRKIFHTLGLSTAEVPEDIIETVAIVRAPLFFYRIKYKLPAGLSVEGGAESNIITYRFSLGPGWGLNYKKFGFSAGAEFTWWHGRLKNSEFNSEITGWRLYPGLSAGYSFPYFSLTLKTELFLILDQTSKIESIKEEVRYDTFSGYAFGIYLEQPLWKDNYIVLGIKSIFTKFYSPLWVAFPTFDRYFYISEIIISYNL